MVPQSLEGTTTSWCRCRWAEASSRCNCRHRLPSRGRYRCCRTKRYEGVCLVAVTPAGWYSPLMLSRGSCCSRGPGSVQPLKVVLGIMALPLFVVERFAAAGLEGHEVGAAVLGRSTFGGGSGRLQEGQPVFDMTLGWTTKVLLLTKHCTSIGSRPSRRCRWARAARTAGRAAGRGRAEECRHWSLWHRQIPVRRGQAIETAQSLGLHR